jgi:hypothetical protein
VQVDVPGGQLSGHWPGSGHSAWLTRPAENLQGKVDLRRSNG